MTGGQQPQQDNPDFLSSFGVETLSGVQMPSRLGEEPREETQLEQTPVVAGFGVQEPAESRPSQEEEQVPLEEQRPPQQQQQQQQGIAEGQPLQHAEPSMQQQQQKAKESVHEEAPVKASKKKKKSKKQQGEGEAKSKRSAKKEEKKAKAAAAESQAQAQAVAAQEQRQTQVPSQASEEVAEKAGPPPAPAWGGVSMNSGVSKQSLSLQQIQEQEEAMRRRQAAQQGAKGADSMTMAARIAKAAGISTGSAPAPYAEAGSVPSASQQVPQSAKGRKSKTKGKSKAQPDSMADMSVDLKRMLGVGGESRAAGTQGGSDSAWGKGGASQNVSLREIQAEEHRKVREREQQAREQQRQAGGVKGPVVAGAWASRSTGAHVRKSMSYSGSVKAATTTATATATEAQDDRLWDYDNGPAQHKANNHQAGSAWGATTVSAADVVARGVHPSQAQAQAQAQAMQQQRAYKQQTQAGRRDDRNAHAAPRGSEGGIKDFPEFYEWCKAELKQLGAHDPTLAELCFSVDSVGDIREYMHGGLGSTPKVSAFASAFIDRKAQLLRTSSGGHKGRPGVDAAGFTAVTGSKKNRRKKGS